MTTRRSEAKSRNAIKLSRTQFAEDPNRKPHEKESAFHLEGDGTHFTVTSFKRVIYAKLLRRPEFEITHINVLDDNGREDTRDSVAEVAADPTLVVIGVVGRLPVGAMNIGEARNSNSQADIVK